MNAVDTNVLLYVYDPRDPVKQAQAATLVSLLESLSEPFKRLDEEVEKELSSWLSGLQRK